MDRREFLKLAAALPAAAYLPAAEGRPVLAVAAIKRAIGGMWQVDGPWYAIIHPSQERQLRDLAARDRWNLAHLDWRKDGRPPMTCQQILDKYRPIHEWDADFTGEVGSVHGFKFITSESV